MSGRNLNESERLEILEKKIQQLENWQRQESDDLKAIVNTINRLMGLVVEIRRELDAEKSYNQEKK